MTNDRTAREAAWWAVDAARHQPFDVSTDDLTNAAIDAYLSAMKEEGWHVVKMEDELMWSAFKAASEARRAACKADDLIAELTRTRRYEIADERMRSDAAPTAPALERSAGGEGEG